MMDLPPPPSACVDHLIGVDRRTSQRYPYQGKILCQSQAIQKDNPWLLGASQDLSATGIGFILHRRLDPGTMLTLELERPKRDSWSLFPARVTHATPQPDGNWKLGCALVKALSEEELHDWLNGPQAKATASP